jgi:1-acyl-sn-glycerol-3-phosphate acyltransferase
MLSNLRSMLWAAPMIVLATMLMGTLSLIAALIDRSGRVAHWIARAWGWMLVRIAGIRLRVVGRHWLDTGHPFVYAANHRSLMDIPVLLPVLPGQFRFFATRGLFKIPFIGTHLRAAGHIRVNRHNPREAIRSLAEGARVIAEKGVSVLVFPEGGRTGGELRQFRDGAAYVAIKAGVPVVPIYIRGMREVLPMGSLKVRPAAVEVNIGQPIPTAGMKLADRGELTQRIFDFFLECEGAAPSPANQRS